MLGFWTHQKSLGMSAVSQEEPSDLWDATILTKLKEQPTK